MEPGAGGVAPNLLGDPIPIALITLRSPIRVHCHMLHPAISMIAETNNFVVAAPELLPLLLQILLLLLNAFIILGDPSPEP